LKNSRAFTLVELLVAMSVTSLIVVGMLRLFMDGSVLWQRQNEKLDTFREARAALQVMARDFAGVRPAAGAPSDFPVLALEHHPEAEEEDKVNHELYALSAIRNQGRSDLCAIGYFCAWDAGKNAFILRRQCTESTTTFALLKQALPAGSPMLGPQPMQTVFARPLAGEVQSVDDLASYIWDVKVEIPEGGTPAAPIPVPWPQGRFNRELPSWIEVRFKALGASAARKIAGSAVTRETWFQPDSNLYRTHILPGQQQFVTRIKLCR
jgi:prepilin-type N-terminal cleavage/methylation domain-containing protein